MLRELLTAFARALAEPAPRPRPESTRHLKRLAEQLNEKATRFRTVASRGVLLEQRVEVLETDSAAWERRARERVVREDLDLTASVQRICGRLEGQLQEARAELATLRADELHLRSLLTDGRKEFARLVEHARNLGHDVSECLLYIDLTRPERVADEELLADEGRDFVARIIDGAGVH